MKQNFESVKQVVNLVEVIRSETGLSLKQVGSDTLNASKCPFCGGHDCFRIKPKEQFWKCFQCDAKGDVFSFVQQFKQLSATGSLAYLAEFVGLDHDHSVEEPNHRHSNNIQKIKDLAYEMLKTHAEDNFQTSVLTKGGQQMTLLETLTKARDHSHELIDSFGIVPSHKGLTEELLKYGFNLDDIQRAGFANKAGKDFFPSNVLLFPIYFQSQLSHFEIKDPSGKHKFKSRKEHRHKSAIFFDEYSNSNEFIGISDSDYTIVVEGVHDVLSIVGKTNYSSVVATLGQLTQQHIERCLQWSKQGKTIFICFDNDEAGRRYTKSISQAFQKQNLLVSLRIIKCDEAKDIDELLRCSENPAKEFQQLLNTSSRVSAIQTSVIKKDNRYFTKKQNDQESFSNAISNFTFSVHAELYDQEDCIRELILQNTSLDKVGPVPFTTRDLSTVQEFGRRLLQLGTFAFWGTSNQLKETLLLEFSAYCGKKMFLLDHVGYIEERKVWVFENGIFKNQQFFKADSNGSIWIDENTGFKIRSLSSGGDRHGLPRLIDLGENEANRCFIAFLDAILDNLGGYEGWLAFGFVIASVYASEIVEKHGYFPFLFISGKHQSGKNVLANILMASMGISNSEIESLPAVRTSVGLLRKMSYFSNLWVWLDEYRATNKHSIDDLLRNVYNRVGRTTGIKSQFGTQHYPVRSIVGISGEHQPQDPATRSRCVFIKLSGARRNDAAYSRVSELIPKLSGIYFWLIKTKDNESTQQILATIEDIRMHFLKAGLPAREAGNLAIPTACLLDKWPKTEFLDWVTESGLSHQQECFEEDTLERFFDDVYHLQIKGQVTCEYIKSEPPKIFLWLRGIHSVWEENNHRKGKTSFPYDALLGMLKEEAYFIDHNFLKRMGHKKTPRKVIVLNKDEGPDILRSISDYASEKGSL